MTTAPTPEEIASLSENDFRALTLALDQVLAGEDDSPDDAGRAEQLRDFLEDGKHTWLEVAEAAAYGLQMRLLELRPYQTPPCLIFSDADAAEILREGPRGAMDGSGFDISDCRSARLLRRMLRWGISPFDPDPVEAIRREQRAKKVVQLRP